MTTPRKTLLLIDVMPLLYRGHFAFARRPRLTSGGLNTSALFIFCSLVLDMLGEEGATHAALAVDSSPTFRHERYPAYKAQREKMPEELADAIPMAREFAEAMRLPWLKVEGFEADDVLGTLSAKGREAGWQVCLFTPDKDFAQLVRPGVTLCRPGRGNSGTERYGVAEVRELWGLASPEQMIELLGLAGDASDNIPGIHGVGEKTAHKLLAEYGTVEGVIAHAADLKGALSERVAQHAEEARLSRWLATIRTDAPVPTPLEALRIQRPDREALAQFCHKYEFATLARKLNAIAPATPEATDQDLPLFAAAEAAAERQQPSASGDGSPVELELPFLANPVGEHPGEARLEPAAPSPEDGFARLGDLPHQYHLADSEEAVETLLSTLSEAGEWAFDTETTGLDPWSAELVGVSFCTRPAEAWYLPLPREAAARRSLFTRLQSQFDREAVRKIGHNLKFDLAMLRSVGIDVRGPLWDTMLAHYVCDPTERHSMDAMARALLRYAPIPIEALIGKKGPDQRTMDQVPVDTVAEYAAEDADVTMRLYQKLAVTVRELRVDEALQRCENALLPVLLDMESTGIRVDADCLRLMGTELAAEIEDLKTRILQAAGTEFNLASPKQLGEVLFEVLGLPPARRTPTGQFETSEEVLTSLVGQHPIVPMILEHRACSKLKSTYVDRLPDCIRPATGRVHTRFNQALTETGRLSSDHPNLQNIPIRTERGRRIREAFVARDANHRLLSADYSQIELRVMAALSRDPTLIEAFRNDADIHLETAARVHKVTPEYVTGDMRAQAKMVNFGIIYGISAFGLAQRLGIPRRQASELIEAYFELYPGVRNYMERTVAEARESGAVRTLLGRRRPLRDIASRNATLRAAAERLAINTPVQGTAAELIKLAMVSVHEAFRQRNLKARMVLQIHDELLFDVPRDEVDEVRQLVEERMTGALDLGVPLKVDVGVGTNWLEAH